MPACTVTPAVTLPQAARIEIDRGRTPILPLSDLVCVSAEDAAADVLRGMQRLGFRRALVTDRGALVGVIGEADLRAYADQDEYRPVRDILPSAERAGLAIA